jgi:predicted DNA-binding transcriptional regulator YafY
LLHDISPAAAEAVEADHRPCKPDGWIKATIPVQADEVGARQLLYLGADMEVLEPRDLRAAIATLARSIAATYRTR